MKFKDITESSQKCPHCGGPLVEYSGLMEKKDACYYKVKASAKVWPSAYASGRLVQCRKKGAGNYGNKSEGVAEGYRDRRDAYQRDQDNAEYGMNKRQSRAYQADGGGNDERHDLDPTEWYIVKDGKMFKATVYPNQVQSAMSQGFSPSREEAKAKADKSGMTEGADPEILFYAKLPNGQKVYARVKDAEQLDNLQQQYRDAEIKTFDYQRPDVIKWLESRRINLRKFVPGMVQTMGDGGAGLNEFAPGGGDNDGNDGFSDDTLRQLAAQWYNGDEDPRVEQTLAAAGWEIGQDEGYDDTPGVFVVQAGDINGNSYISWPAHELEGLTEGSDPASAKFGKYIKQYFDQIYEYGDDGLNYLDNNAPFWNELMDKYNGEIDDIIAMEPADVLKQAALELKDVASDLKYELDEQGVAEGYYDLNDEGMQPIDLSSKPSFNEIVVRYSQLYYQSHEGEYDDEEAAESDAIEQYVAKRFGEKGSAHLQKAAETSFFGRNDKPYGRTGARGDNLGRASQPVGNFRTTKAGKMHGQDANVMKGQVANRLGKHPAPNLPEAINSEYNDEAGMADNNLETLERAVQGIDDLIQSGDNLPEWCQEKIAVAKSMLVAVWDYMYSEEASDEVDPEIDAMFEAMDQLVHETAHAQQLSVDLVWESFEALDDHMLYETAAWRRKEGKSKKGGLNAKGVASYRRENPGSKLQMAVTTKPSKLKPGSKAAKRRKSFCARMSGVKGPMKKPNGKPTRKALALRKWNC
jgi:hypothetical protein